MRRAFIHFSIGISTLMVLSLLPRFVLAQQKVQFTQYMFNGLVINPAYAGADEVLSLTLLHRSQWSGIENAPSTQTFSAHSLFKKKHIGLGLTLVNDRIGVHKNISAITNYAYHLRTGEKSFLSFGLQAGVHSRKSDYASLMGNSGTDPKLGNSPVSATFINFGAGLYFRSPRLHVGFSAPELIPENMTLNDTMYVHLSKAQFFLFTKYRIPVSSHIDIEPGMLVKYLAGVPVSFDLNLNTVFYKVLTAGLSYRKAESVDFLLRAQVTEQLQFGYSYDHAIGDIVRLSNGSHEVMINYLFRYSKAKVTSPR
jgi:type IX secretion system PorP/SprF family membrane protein